MDKTEVNYVPEKISPTSSTSSDSKLIPSGPQVGPAGPIGPSAGRTRFRRPGQSRLTLCLSGLAVVLCLAAAVLAALWVLDVPAELELQKEALEDLAEVVEVQQEQLEHLHRDKARQNAKLDWLQEQHQEAARLTHNVCAMTKEVGPCRMSVPRWHYDSSVGQCKQFQYGGCQGNANNFVTLQACAEACENDDGAEDAEARVAKVKVISGQEAAGVVEVEGADPCQLVPSAGPCRSQLPRYYFDPEDKTCKKFLYGGCAGNANNFVTADACNERCSKTAGKTREDKTKAACSQPKVVGMCRAAMPRFYYDQESGQCRSFTFGGCGGNENNFATKEKCASLCERQPVEPEAGVRVDEGEKLAAEKASEEENGPEKGSEVEICRQPAETGPCRGAKPRFYYDHEANECKSFTYGGCQGNKNNFVEKAQCERYCKAYFDRLSGYFEKL